MNVYLHQQLAIVKLLDERLYDESTSVRDAALDIIKKFMVANPKDTQRYFHTISNRVKVY